MKIIIVFLFVLLGSNAWARVETAGDNLGATLRWKRLGNPEGKPLLVLPGLGLMPSSFEKIFGASLQDKYDIYIVAYRDTKNRIISSPAYRESGKSIWRVFNSDIDFYVNKILAKRRQKVSLLGFSMGSLAVYSYLSGVSYLQNGQQFYSSEVLKRTRKLKIDRATTMGFHANLNQMSTWFDFIVGVISKGLPFLIGVERLPYSILLQLIGEQRYFTHSLQKKSFLQYNKFIKRDDLINRLSSLFNETMESANVLNILGEHDVIIPQRDDYTVVIPGAAHQDLLFDDDSVRRIQNFLE